MSILIAINGKPRSGKNTLADFLTANLGGAQFAIADPLYSEVAHAFCTTPEALKTHTAKTVEDDMLAGWRSDDPGYRAMLKRMGEDLFSPRTSRYHLRFWGTEYRRNREPRYWADKLLMRLAATPAEQPIVIDDMRAYDKKYLEYAVLREYAAQTGRQFMLIEVQREGEEAWGHSSDDAFPDHMVDLHLKNVTGRPEVMQRLALEHLNEMTGT